MGAELRFLAEVLEVKGKRVYYRVEGHAAHGMHARAVILMERLKSKR